MFSFLRRGISIATVSTKTVSIATLFSRASPLATAYSRRTEVPTIWKMSQKSITSFFSNKAPSSPSSSSPFSGLKSPLQEKPASKNQKVPAPKTTPKQKAATPKQKKTTPKQKITPKQKKSSADGSDASPVSAAASQVKKVRISEEVEEMTVDASSSPPSSPLPATSRKRRKVQMLSSGEESASDSENSAPVFMKTSPSPSSKTVTPKRKTAKLSKEFREKLANRVQTPHVNKICAQVKDEDSSPEEEEESSPAVAPSRPTPIASRLSSFSYKRTKTNISPTKASSSNNTSPKKTSLLKYDTTKTPDMSNPEESTLRKKSFVKMSSASESEESETSPKKKPLTLKKNLKSSSSESEESEPSPKKKRSSVKIYSSSESEESELSPKKKPLTLKNDLKSSSSQSEESEASPKKKPLTLKKNLKKELKTDKKQTSGKEKSSKSKADAKIKIEEKLGKSETKPNGETKPVGEKKPIAGKGGMSLVTSATAVGYNPAKTNYNPRDDACWKAGQDAPYRALTDALKAVEGTKGRLAKTLILTNLLRSVGLLSPDDLYMCVYLCTNQVAPRYEGKELGMGETVVMRAIQDACGVTVASQKAKMKGDQYQGDLGLIAESCKANQKMMFKPKALTIKVVYQTLLEISEISGTQGQSKKVALIKKMLVSCQGSEARFVTRSLLGKLRCGLAELTVLVAVGHATVLTPPGADKVCAVSKSAADAAKAEAADIIKTCFCEFPNFKHIISVVREHGVRKAHQFCKLSPGIPVKPMLAHPTKGISEVLHRFEDCEFTCEYKYDGERAQIQRREDGSITIFSRNQENHTTKYPDVISRLGNSMSEDTKTFILDCEVVAWDLETKKILPFQILTTRKRKDADENQIKVQVCLFAFDLLYLNGESLVRCPFRKRRSLLHSAFQCVEGEFVFAQARDCSDPEEIQEFLDESIRGQCEGLMVKSLDRDATYEIAKRSHNWLKVKKDYLEGCGDSLDLVVMGGFYGKGRRSGTYGGYLLACYDPDSEQFQAICKIGTGFKDDELVSHHADLSPHVIESPKSYYAYPENSAPDVWFSPAIVWEVKCADLSISPIYCAAAGIVDPTKGISLRFPRFVRVREDKTPEDATCSEQVAEMYSNQDNVNKQTKQSTEDFEEDY